MPIYVQNVDLIEDMPEWAKTDPILQSLFYSLDIQFKEVIECIPENVIIPVIRQLNYSPLVDLLAYQFHVDFYDPLDTLDRRRNLVADSIVWHRKKGTVGLVQEVLDYWYPGGATLEEWFDYMAPFPPNYPIDDPGGLGTWHDRYRFRITIDQMVIKPEDEAQATKIIERYKPISRWPEAFYRVKQSALEDIYWAGGSVIWQYITSGPMPNPLITQLIPDTAAPFTFTRLDVIGENFQVDSVIHFDGIPLPTTVIDTKRLRATIPFDVGQEGDKPVQVITPNMADSNILQFVVTDILDPILSECVPWESLENEVIPFAVKGFYFQATSVIEFDGVTLATTYIDANNLQASAPLDVGPRGAKPVRVLTAGPPALPPSNTVIFNVSSVPVLIQLIPDTAPENTDTPLRCIGNNFVASSEIIWDGAPLPFTKWIDAQTLEALMPFNTGAVRDVPVFIQDHRTRARDARAKAQAEKAQKPTHPRYRVK